MTLKDFYTIKERRQFIEKETGTNLTTIGNYSLDDIQASSKNCENMIGAAQIPLGIAGPLRTINYKLRTKNYYIPLATTEGALVASVNRGCKAVTQSGGVYVEVEDTGITRGPVFKTQGLKQSLEFKKWLDDHFKNLQEIAQTTSSHLALKKLGTRLVGKYVYVRFYFDTGLAMGMNMATIATTAIADYIENETGIRCLSIAGNFDTDKKAAWLNFISGRGKKVWAEVILPPDVLKTTLKTTAQKIYDVWLGKCLLGSIMSGSLGFNAHYANIIAALFIATGQDPSHVVEGSMGVTTTEVIEDSLHVSIYIPSCIVGVIGGGTALETQKESLSILGLKGKSEDSLKLAQIVGAAVLAGEISLLASLSQGSLAKAHKKLGRGK
ncbi:hypothetical protein A2773_01255 [Candidatus Gottesmanbacteria bacterium RIFCSPHIGHO2_01_FULL_39_10]|uniref:hydroxymethylglutaryl-CoA reductase (NADPH) n=1 Tax=Candidatus Gottesmanbacteria bacterium RIFCSPHIGHO2_01_FULL_39_10 TaxID=1798375 RepID=A0A1F5ZR07_9BACT|nr:MAG: hypothetical protein A2773_01255 [Candidatus Gottesmanbacteria bacterium RIFCSPHIGHO2_01_FULL_39_10]